MPNRLSVIAPRSVALAFLAASALAAPSAFAQGAEPPPPASPTSPTQTSPTVTVFGDGGTSQGAATKDKVKDEETDKEKKADEQPKRLPWHDSILLFDQSISTETAGIGGQDYLSRAGVASYQIWTSFRPRYYFYEDETQSFNVNARMDYYKTLTNGEELTSGGDSTRFREDVFGDIRLNADYARKLHNDGGWVTTIKGGPAFIFPTSSPSRAAGTILAAGASLGLRQEIPLLKDGDWLKSFHVGAAAIYTHSFRQATTANPGDFTQERIDPEGRPLDDHQMTGKMLTSDSVFSVLDTGFQVTPKLSLTVDMIWWSRWRFSPPTSPGQGCPDGYAVQIMNGVACANSSAANPNPPNYGLSTWFLASIDYQMIDEIGLSLGYYTLTDNIAPDGTHQSWFWAPDSSRFFLTATFSLDEIFETIRGDQTTTPEQTKRTVVKNDKKPGVGFLGSTF